MYCVAVANDITIKLEIVTGPLPIATPYADQSTVPTAPRATVVNDRSCVWRVCNARMACGKKAPPDAADAA